ncbi:MAG TPA: hypothetical protein VF331_17010 [Polyangiales bacterium]
MKLLWAAVETCRANRDGALSWLEASLQVPALVRQAPVVCAYAQRRKGELIGGAEGLALVEQADAYVRSRGVKNPACTARLYGPGELGSV